MCVEFGFESMQITPDSGITILEAGSGGGRDLQKIPGLKGLKGEFQTDHLAKLLLHLFHFNICHQAFSIQKQPLEKYYHRVSR